MIAWISGFLTGLALWPGFAVCLSRASGPGRADQGGSAAAGARSRPAGWRAGRVHVTGRCYRGTCCEAWPDRLAWASGESREAWLASPGARRHGGVGATP